MAKSSGKTHGKPRARPPARSGGKKPSAPASGKRSRRRAANAEAPAPLDPGRPFWVPQGADLDFVPREVQQAVAELIEPVYRQFVVNASDGLEKSLGVTISHLLWLEILEQFDLKQEYTQVQSVLGMAGNRQGAIAQHLRLIDSKLRIGYFLVRLHELRQRQAERANAAQALPDPASALPEPPRPAPFPLGALDSAGKEASERLSQESHFSQRERGRG